ncbi:MAG TPA: hypothetical protein VGI45_09065 [Terracidiphilus sp.]
MASITISNISLSSWQGNTFGVQLRIYTNGNFTANGGNLHQATIQSNPASLSTFFDVYNCTYSSGSLFVPAVTLDSTTDSPDNPSASYSAVLFDTNSGKQIQQFGTYNSFQLSPSPTTTTWGNIFAAGSDI